MIYWAQNNNVLLTGQWALLLAPGLMIALLAVSMTFINFGVDRLSNPRLREGSSAMSLLKVQNLSIEYDTPGVEAVKAVTDVNLELEQGEFVGLVGESGSGKSTLGFAHHTSVESPRHASAKAAVLFDGKDITSA
jgi:ABC-type multidrug transport system fused ATPase/permease subunit